MSGRMPIIEVTDDNFLTVLPAMKKAIQGASFLAVDCELSGMGDKKKLVEQEMDLRYQYTVETAHSHAIVSLGLSCFTCKSLSTINLKDGHGVVGSVSGVDKERSHNYLVQTFNLLTLCSGSFTVECSAHKFLLRHGFDFNKLYSKGLQYYKGCDRQKHEPPSVRHLFSAIVEHCKPIVVHNGLMDLIFLYQSFYADLPRKLDTFAADLKDMFPAGIYDTKYIAEYHQHMPASYLEYLFKKMQLRSARCEREGEWHVRVNFPPYPPHLPSVEWHPYQQILSYSLEADQDKREICYNQGLHGWCTKGSECPNSHDINKIVRTLQPQGAKKRNNSKYSGANTTSLAQIIQRQAEKVKREEQRQEHGNGVKKGEAAAYGHKTAREKKVVVLRGEAKRLSNTLDDSSLSPVKSISQKGTSNGEIPQERGASRENRPKNTAVNLEERISSERGVDDNTGNMRWHNGQTEGEEKDVQRRTEMRDREGTWGEPNSDCDEDSLGGTKKRKTSTTTTTTAETTGGEMTKKAKTTEDVDSSTDKDNRTSETTTMENPKSAPREKVKNTKAVRELPRSPVPVMVNGTGSKPSDAAPQYTSSGHRAGFDAFMTGYIFANHVSGHGTLTSSDAPFTPDNLGMAQLVNRVYLMGKTIPFLIRAGTYASTSSNHASKIPKLRKVIVG